MSALLKNEIYEETGYEAAAPETSARWMPVVIAKSSETPALVAATPGKRSSMAKDIALFLISPFIGLAYVLAMPVVALAALAWIGGKALVKKAPVTRTLALAAAAPFIGLAAILTAPVVGLGALAYIGASGLASK